MSVSLHAILFACLTFLGHPNSFRSPHPTALQTRTLSADDFAKEFPLEANKLKEAINKKQKKQIVQVDDQLKSDRETHPLQENFLGRHNQRFDQNTRAARVGAFKNVLKEGLKDARDLFKIADENAIDSANKDDPRHNIASKGETHSFAQNRSNGISRAPASVPEASPQGDGFSATDDYLPHIAVGANTLLNTREYKFASFYERIREKLNHQWQRRVRAEMESLYLQGVHQIEGERATKLRIALDREGHVVKIEKFGSAGYQELDRAAVGAFQAAGPFSNPPTELLEGSQQLVSIDWHFVIVGGRTGMQVRVRRHPAGL